MSETRIQFDGRSYVRLAAMRELLESAHLRATLYWVARPNDKRTRGAMVVSFFTLRDGKVSNIDWEIRDFLHDYPLPQQGFSGAIVAHASENRNCSGLVLPRPIHAALVARHISSLVWNDPGYVLHEQL